MRGPYKVLVFISILLVLKVECQRINLAATANSATCTASSELDTNSQCEKALDSIVTPNGNEWITSREGPGSFIRIQFQSSSLVDEIRVLQRCRDADKAKQLSIRFDDNGAFLLDLDCESGSTSAEDCTGSNWEILRLSSPVVSSSVNISVTSVCADGAFNGAREIVVMGQYTEESSNEKNLALLRNGGTCDASSYSSSSYTCDNAIDGVIGANTNECWLTQINDGLNSNITISFGGRSKIRRLRLKNRCQVQDQMKTVALEFDNGAYIQNVTTTCYSWSYSYSCPDQVWDEWTFPDIIASSVTIRALEGCSTPNSMSYQEVEVYGVLESDQLCPFDFESVPGLSTCYKFISDTKNVTKASETCNALDPDAHLVEINSVVEQDALARTMENMYLDGVTCSTYYTGGYRTGTNSSEWFWAYSGERVPLPIWGAGSPGDGNTYIAMSHRLEEDISERWKWASSFGKNNYCFICEI